MLALISESLFYVFFQSLFDLLELFTDFFLRFIQSPNEKQNQMNIPVLMLVNRSYLCRDQV